MKQFLMGLIVGLSMAGAGANAGIISHVMVYEIGKHNGKAEAKESCVCPPTTKPGDRQP